MWRYILFFATLYFIQGAALAYVVNFQKPFLAGHGVSKETLGLFTSLLLLPFIIKIFLGMLSDRVPWGRFGSRKPYMTLGLLLFAFCYFSLAHVSPKQDFAAFAALTWLASFGLAMFDTCADGWAVDAVEESAQSTIQAAMVAGKSLGLITMSYLFGMLAQDHGYALIFEILGALSLAVLITVLLVPYAPRSGAAAAGVVHGWSDLLNWFYLCFAAYAIVYSIASFGTDGLVTLHLSDARGATPYDIGVYGMFRGLGALLGAVTYAFINHRLGLARTQALALILLGLGCLSPLAGWSGAVGGLLWGCCWGFQETAFVTVAMRFAEGAWAATFFALSMIFSNVGTSLGEVLAAPLVPQFGYAPVFAGFAAVAWSALVFIPLMVQPVAKSDLL